MKEKLRLKTIVAIVTLAIAIVLIVGATFAWLSLSTQPKVEEVKASVARTAIFEIALANAENMTTGPGEATINDYERQDTWGELVDFTGMDRIKLECVATYEDDLYEGTGGLGTVIHDEHARTAGLKELGEREYTDNGFVYRSEDGLICAAGFGIWMRSNISETGNVRAELKDIEFSRERENGVPVNLCLSIYRLQEGTLELLRSRNLSYASSDGTESVVLFTGEDDEIMAAGQPYLIEIMSYYEGETESDKNGIIAADIGVEEEPLSAKIGLIEFTMDAIENEQ